MYNEQNKVMVVITRFIAGLYAKLFLRLEVKGKENIPLDRGVIIAPNHLSYWDPPLVAIAIQRYMFFMGKESLLKKPVFGWYLKKLGTFPVKRGTADIRAFKTTLRLLKSEKIVLLFPEGTRGDWKNMGEPMTGIGSIACLSAAPVVPAIITYAKKIKSFKFNKASVEFGRPMYFDQKGTRNKESYLEFGREIIRNIKKLDTSGFYG